MHTWHPRLVNSCVTHIIASADRVQHGSLMGAKFILRWVFKPISFSLCLISDCNFTYFNNSINYVN